VTTAKRLDTRKRAAGSNILSSRRERQRTQGTVKILLKGQEQKERRPERRNDYMAVKFRLLQLLLL